MSKVSNRLVVAAVFAAFLGSTGVCMADVSLHPPEMEVREGDRTVEIWWNDPDPQVLVLIEEPVLGTAKFPWLGNATLDAKGFYTGGCDRLFNIFIGAIADTMEFSWDEVVDWETGATISRRVSVSETDYFYELSHGIQVAVNSEGLYEPDTVGWSGPVPGFHGIYAAAEGSDPDTAVLFTFTCTSGGDLAPDTGTDIAFGWENDIGESGSFVVNRADSSVTVDRGFKVKFPTGTYQTGESFAVEVWTPLVAGDRFSVNAETFDGYLILRHSVEDRPPHEPPDSIRHYKVIAEISKCDTFEFFSDDNGEPDPYGTRYFIDRGIAGDQIGIIPDPDVPTVLNGFPYNYAVVTYDWSSLHEQLISDPAWRRVVPAVPPAPTANGIRVVPNPYVGRAGWETGAESKIQFVNIPRGAKIRIYDAAGGYINTVYPNYYSYNGAQQGTADWNLMDSDGKRVVSGIYIFRAESSSGNEVGRFIVVR